MDTMKEEKKEKLNLDELKVQSFVTSLLDEKFHTIKGGEDTNIDCEPCESADFDICECINFISCENTQATSPCDDFCA